MSRKGSKMSPEHKANWLASVRRSNNRPASDNPAAGGWGGPAGGGGAGGANVPQKATRGRGANKRFNEPDRAGQITSETAPALRALVGTPEGQASTASREQIRAANCERMEGVLLEVADNPDQPGKARTDAAIAYLNRVQGMPVQRNLNINSDATRSADELQRELDELDRRQALANPAGVVGEAVPGKLSGVVH